jgi:hypothetical protein
MGRSWMRDVKRVKAGWGSSNSYIGTKPKVVWHTTESDPGTISGNLNYAASVGYGPHLWWDPYTGDIVQSLPVTIPATALADPYGKGTNRWGTVVIQIEVIGRAKNAPLATSPLKNWDQIRGFLRSWGIPEEFPAGAPVGAVSGNRNVYSASSPAGHYCHSQVVDNSHVDPGKVDTSVLFAPRPAAVKRAAKRLAALIAKVRDRLRRLRRKHRQITDVVN